MLGIPFWNGAEIRMGHPEMHYDGAIAGVPLSGLLAVVLRVTRGVGAVGKTL